MAEDLSLEEVQMATIEELAAKVAGLEQQMAAITVPPTEYYTSIFSGEDIDLSLIHI